MVSSTKAVILAGGRGERMGVLCHDRPKPALPFAGRFKVVDFSLSNCINSGISDIAVLTDYQHDHMADYLRQWHLMNASATNLCVLEPGNGSYEGTADAVYQNLNHFDKGTVETVLILPSDHVYTLDYSHMLAFHRQVKADVTVAVIPVPIEQAHRFGTVTVDTNGKISSFMEKSSMPQSNIASMGIYVFNRNILIERLTEDAGNPRSRHDFGYSILPKMVKQDRVFAYRFNGFWQDIGTIEAYHEANMELTQEQPSFSLNGTSSVLPADQYFVPPHIGEKAFVRNSLISPGCVIKGLVINSILSPGVMVDEHAVVRNSVIMEDTRIGNYSIVDRCVLDEKVNIGSHCHIGSDANLTPSDLDVTVLGQGVTVPPHTAVARGCKISPHVGPADFATNAVSPYAVVSNTRKGEVFRYEAKKYRRTAEDALGKAHCHSI